LALFHLHVTQVKRSAGQSVVTSAAYRAGEKLYSEYYGEVSDYTHKGGVVCTDILLPPQAPNQYQDRATLWNAVEKAERGKKAQLAYSFDIALQNEFSLEENIALARQFVSEQLVGRGMIADFAIHQPDKEDGGIPNPHFHVLCPIRPIEPDGKWGCKQRRRYRLDEDGNRIIMVDRKLLKNPNGLILGTPGSGKSFSSKREITNVFLVTEDDVLVCDPEDEYAPLVKRLGGQVVKISPTSTQYVNPMDINLNYSDDDNPLALKVDFLLSFCDIVVGSKDGLQPVEKTVIDRCVRNVYRPYLADPDPARMPILQDLYDELLAQPETEAQRIAAALELYVTGSLNVFNHRTNVELTNRLVCFNIKELGKQLKQLGMLVIQDQVWNRVTVNRAAGKTTRYYVDEFHLLLKGELASWSVEIWKRFRKWGGIPTGITQNIKDLLASREIENIFENSDFIYMLNQAAGDRQILAKQLNISPHQLSYVTHSSEGEGLLFYGNVILPFIDRFPKDTELYRIMTTKPQEVSG